MKRGTPRHPKVDHLMSLMRWDRATAVGTLELLWHFADEFAPQGDVGKFDDRRIEAALDYLPHGQRKSGKLIEALIESRWLDRHSTCRIIIHDWLDHCQSNVVQRLAKKGLTTVQGESKDILTESKRQLNGGLTESYVESNEMATFKNQLDSSLLDENKPLALPCLALPKPIPTRHYRNGNDPIYAVWFETEFWPQYWRHDAKTAGAQELAKHAKSADDRNRILSAMIAQKPQFEAREKQYRPHLRTWAHQQRFNDEPEPLFQEPPKNVRSLI